MTMSSTGPRASAPVGSDGMALLRSLLLCQLAEYADKAAECHATIEALTGQHDADSLVERELVEASAAHFETVVEEARAALQRMDAGTYGVCEACRAPIPYERLEALPHVRRCVNCPDPAAQSLV